MTELDTFDELKYRIVRNDEGVFYYNSNNIETMTFRPLSIHSIGMSMGSSLND